MQLIFLRHGPAEARRPDLADESRALTRKGRAKTKKACTGLAKLISSDQNTKLGMGDVQIWSSPLLRARQTAGMLAKQLNLDMTEHMFIASGNTCDLISALKNVPEDMTIIITGHEPMLSEWSAELCGCPLPFKKAAAAAINYSISKPESSQLIWFLQPRFLRRLGD